MYEEAFAQTSAREVTRLILLGEDDLVSNDDTPEGCLMVQSALAVGPALEELQQRLADMRRSAEAEVAKRFERAKKDGELPIGGDPEVIAGYIMTVAAGLAVQAKSGLSTGELVAVAETAILIWPE